MNSIEETFKQSCECAHTGCIVKFIAMRNKLLNNCPCVECVLRVKCSHHCEDRKEHANRIFSSQKRIMGSTLMEN